MTSKDLTDRRREARAEFWRTVGTPGPIRAGGSDLDEGPLWPLGSSAYLHVTTAHTGIIATDGLSDRSSVDQADVPAGPGVELYIEGVELLDEDPGTSSWLVRALEECAGALAGTGGDVGAVLAEHGLLSLELSGEGAPADWLHQGRLGALLGVELPARATGFTVDEVSVPALSVVPLRPAELEAVLAEGALARLRVAKALADQGWYSYADTERPAVV